MNHTTDHKIGKKREAAGRISPRNSRQMSNGSGLYSPSFPFNMEVSQLVPLEMSFGTPNTKVILSKHPQSNSLFSSIPLK